MGKKSVTRSAASLTLNRTPLPEPRVDKTFRDRLCYYVQLEFILES